MCKDFSDTPPYIMEHDFLARWAVQHHMQKALRLTQLVYTQSEVSSRGPLVLHVVLPQDDSRSLLPHYSLGQS